MSGEVTTSHLKPVFVLYGFWDLKPQAVTEFLAALGSCDQVARPGPLLCGHSAGSKSETLAWDRRSPKEQNEAEITPL